MGEHLYATAKAGKDHYGTQESHRAKYNAGVLFVFVAFPTLLLCTAYKQLLGFDPSELAVQ